MRDFFVPGELCVYSVLSSREILERYVSVRHFSDDHQSFSIIVEVADKSVLTWSLRYHDLKRVELLAPADDDGAAVNAVNCTLYVPMRALHELFRERELLRRTE